MLCGLLLRFPVVELPIDADQLHSVSVAGMQPVSPRQVLTTCFVIVLVASPLHDCINQCNHLCPFGVEQTAGCPGRGHLLRAAFYEPSPTPLASWLLPHSSILHLQPQASLCPGSAKPTAASATSCHRTPTQSFRLCVHSLLVAGGSCLSPSTGLQCSCPAALHASMARASR